MSISVEGVIELLERHLAATGAMLAYPLTKRRRADGCRVARVFNDYRSVPGARRPGMSLDRCAVSAPQGGRTGLPDH